MRFRFILFLALLLRIFPLQAVRSQASSRRVVMDETQRLVLVQDGQLQFDIVLAPGASKVTAFAARELQRFLWASFGEKPEVVSDVRQGRVAIVVGDNAWSRQAGLSVSSLPRDGFFLKQSGSSLHIVGRDHPTMDPEWASNQLSIWANYFERGTLNGVYEFLERFIGVRFYFPGDLGTIVPGHRTLSIPRVDILECPDSTVRLFTWYKGAWHDPSPIWGADGVRGKTLNLYRLRHETQYLPCNHGLLALNYHGRFADSHPEYFSLLGGRRTNHSKHPYLCFNSGVVEEIYQDAKAYLSGSKSMADRHAVNQYGSVDWDPSACQPGYVNIMPQDGFLLCQCPLCRSIKSTPAVPGVPDKEISDHIWGMTARIARRLQAEHIPGHITQMAYWPYNRVPDFPLPSNLEVMVGVRGPWGPHNGHDLDSVKAWSGKLKRKVWLWTYAGKFRDAQPSVPSSTPRAIGRFYAESYPYSFGAYMESDTDQYLYHYLNYYVFSKVMWNVRTDVDQLLAEHYRLMYGAAAPLMQEIFDRIERDWLETLQGTYIANETGVYFKPVNDVELWTRIYTRSRLAQMERRYAMAEAQARLPIQKRRVRLMRRIFFDLLKERAKEYHELLGQGTDWTLVVPEKGVEARAYLHPVHAAQSGLTHGQSSEPLRPPYVAIFRDDRSLAFIAHDVPWQAVEILLGGRSHRLEDGMLKVPLTSLKARMPLEILHRQHGHITHRWNFFLGEEDLVSSAFGTLLLDSALDDNLLRNHDFTGKGVPWYGPAYAKECFGAHLDREVFLTGGQSMRLESEGNHSTSIWQYLPTLKPDTPYRISFYLKLEEVKPYGAGGVMSSCFDQVNRYCPNSPLTGTIPWFRVCQEIVTGPETNRKHQAYVNLTLKNASGKVWIDHVRVVEITSPHHRARRFR